MDENKTPIDLEENKEDKKEEVKETVVDTNPETKEEEKKKSAKKGRRIFIIILVLILLIAGIAAIAILISGKTTTKNDKKAKASDIETSLEVGEAKEYSAKNSDGTLTSVEIAEKAKPYVMGVLVYQGDTKYGEGSGIFMSETDEYTYVLTCAHIIDTAGLSVKIQTEDGNSYDAEIVGYDSRTDVGVLRVKGTGFTIAEFGDSSVLKVGEPVYAIGNPGGTAFFGSVTGGIVSAIDRPTATSSSAYTMECIQHDAAINPGNSGGALVNSFGQVVGMNSSKIADTDYEGMGFAIPINVIKDVVDDILESGYVQNRAKLGISYIESSQNQTYSMIVKMNDLPSGSIIIAEIDKSSGLYGTDVEAGDLIIAANGKELDTKNVLLDIIENSEPGDKLELEIAHVNRDYKVETFKVTVELVEDTGSSEVTTEESQEGDFVNPYAK